jgi:hypothetical protein
MALTLTMDERTELERRLRSRTIRSEDARRARVIVMQAGAIAQDQSQPRRDCTDRGHMGITDEVVKEARAFIATIEPKK